ncbi:MAG: response regulator, partial [Gammaproteobacteria bacterium]|nr:response regulator [Gammaproteobacteria bacterium]
EMPHMDGFELVAMLRDDPALQDIPVIVITSRSGDKHRQRIEQSGIQGFLGKPYQEAQLLGLLDKLLNN